MCICMACSDMQHIFHIAWNWRGRGYTWQWSAHNGHVRGWMCRREPVTSALLRPSSRARASSTSECSHSTATTILWPAPGLNGNMARRDAWRHRGPCAGGLPLSCLPPSTPRVRIRAYGAPVPPAASSLFGLLLQLHAKNREKRHVSHRCSPCEHVPPVTPLDACATARVSHRCSHRARAARRPARRVRLRKS